MLSTPRGRRCRLPAGSPIRFPSSRPAVYEHHHRKLRRQIPTFEPLQPRRCPHSWPSLRPRISTFRSWRTPPPLDLGTSSPEAQCGTVLSPPLRSCGPTRLGRRVSLPGAHLACATPGSKVGGHSHAPTRGRFHADGVLAHRYSSHAFPPDVHSTSSSTITRASAASAEGGSRANSTHPSSLRASI